MFSFPLIFILFWVSNISQGANLRNELPIVKIYEIRTTTSTKLEESEHLVDRPPNSNIVVGEDIQPNSKLIMECDSKSFPVQWVYLGDGMPEYNTNTTQTQNSGGITRPDNLFSASLSLGFRRPISVHDSGKYICRSLQNPDVFVFYRLYVADDKKLFVNPTGETIYYKQGDSSVRIPCGVSNPKSTVSLQKSINGLVQCPLNESITYDSTKGFELKVSNYFDPEGSYVCTAGFNNTYQVVSYTLVKDVESTVTPPLKVNCLRNSDCQSTQACIQQGRSGYSCTSPCGSVCGRNTQCDVTNHIPRCNCLPGHSGDPYQACFVHSKPENFEKDPCSPSPCGINTVCERHGGIARCECAPGHQGDPYSRCTMQQQRDPCSPNPCGSNSVCTHRNSFTSCSCKEGYYGRPPYCRAECEVNSHCPSDRACVYGRCRNPCEGACSKFHRTECRVINRQPVCATISCPNGQYGRDCLLIYAKEDGQIIVPERLGEQRTPTMEQVTPCLPFPCGISSECVVKTVQNSVLNTTNELALCQCPPNKTGNADVECYPIAEQRILQIEEISEPEKTITETPNITITTSHNCNPECGINANCTEKNTCVCPKNMHGYPLIKCYPVFCTTVADCDNVNATCVAGKCLEIGSVSEPNTKQCGENAIAINANGNLTCECPSGYLGIASIKCHQITPEISSTNETVTNTTTIAPILNPEVCDKSQCGKNAKCVQSENNVTVCECIKPFNQGLPLVGCELNCSQNTDCPSDHLCHNISRMCVNPCEQEYQPFFVECGRNADCKVVNHIPLCYCPKNFPHGSPNIHCKEEGWMPTHHAPNATCENRLIKCGINAACKRFHDLERCVCIPGHFGSPIDPQGCKVGIQCRIDTQCNLDEECMNGKCLNVCRDKTSCGPLAGCKADNHKATCVCHIGTVRTPTGECETAKGAIAERLLFFRSFEDI